MVKEALSRWLLHKVYKLRRYQTVTGDLPGSMPTAVGANASKAATDKSIEFPFTQVGHSSATITLTVCDIVKIKLLAKVENTNIMISFNRNFPPTKFAIVVAG